MKKLVNALRNFRKNFHKLDKEIRHAFIGAGIVLALIIIGVVVASIILPGFIVGVMGMIVLISSLIFIIHMIQLVEKYVINFIDKKLVAKPPGE